MAVNVDEILEGRNFYMFYEDSMNNKWVTERL